MDAQFLNDAELGSCHSKGKAPLPGAVLGGKPCARHD